MSEVSEKEKFIKEFNIPKHLQHLSVRRLKLLIQLFS
jgi:hypothetical protein